MTPLDIRPAALDALRNGRPIVALESTLVSHGLPWPANLETARAAEAAVRAAGAVPATIAVLAGRPTVGLDDRELEALARGGDIRKASRRDLGAAVAQKATAATTVSATMLLAEKAGIRVFATGGIGGVHRGGGFDVSADLLELGRTPVCVVCAGAKSILDLAATLEVLETNGVPVIGYRTDTFPSFYTRSSGLPVSGRVDSPEEAAALLEGHWDLSGTGVVLALPMAEADAMADDDLAHALRVAEGEAERLGVRGAALTPFLLAHLARLTDGRTLKANRALIVANAALAGAVAVAWEGRS
jgi:pseudouridine-5'-phosphate glycosidase